jgi:hypothetical protein
VNAGIFVNISRQSPDFRSFLYTSRVWSGSLPPPSSGPSVRHSLGRVADSQPRIGKSTVRSTVSVDQQNKLSRGHCVHPHGWEDKRTWRAREEDDANDPEGSLALLLDPAIREPRLGRWVERSEIHPGSSHTSRGCGGTHQGHPPWHGPGWVARNQSYARYTPPAGTDGAGFLTQTGSPLPG